MRLLFLILLLLKTAAASQTLDISITGAPDRPALLSSLSGEKVVPFDSVPGTGGRFRYTPRPALPHPGVYRLTIDRNRWVDFIYDRADVTLRTDAAHIFDSLKADDANGNSLYYKFLRMSRELKTKSELLQLVLSRYPSDDPYYDLTRKRLVDLQREYERFVADAQAANPTSFAARYIRSARLPTVDGSLPPAEHLEYLKAHALDPVDFTDSELIYSDLFAAKAIEYLSYYRNPQLPKDLLEKEFDKAVDSLLGKARANEIVYQHVTEYLLEGFKNYGFDHCIDYILDNYVVKDNLCLDESSGGAIQKMVEQKKLLTPGATVPDIVLPDTSGKVVDIRKLNAAGVLLVFYSSACPHCRTMLPELQKAYAARKNRDLEVVTIALDTDRGEWTQFIRDHSLGWISLSDLAGWGSPLVDAYHIYATPTLVMLDGAGRVVGVPMTVDDARKYF